MELSRIGRYEVQSLIGQGGMSAVYLGYDPRSHREVAIKVLPPYYMHATKFRERFEREALTISMLEHPAIVPVYDMGEEDGQPYIVMRYMSGGSLSDKLAKGNIPLRVALDMLLRLAPALDTAHARGVTHRDVKPDNLLFDKYDNVYLSDFGLARLRETIGFANISDGSVMGTPAYMSPEQIQGDRQIDGRSDIYSLGVVLFHMLCGKVPFESATAASVMMMHLTNPVPQIHPLNTSLPLAIQGVLDTALAKNPDDRYQTAGEFAKALQAITTGGYRKVTLADVTTATAGRTPVDSKSRQIDSRKTPIPGELTADKKAAVPAGTAAQPRARRLASALPLWGWLLGLVLLAILSVALIQWSRGGFPFSLLPASSLNPHATSLQNGPISTSSATESSSQPSNAPGRADKLAFLNASDIWTSNMDGTNLSQLTNDGTPKNNLHWSPDGQSVIYTSENCIRLVGLQTRQILTPTCFANFPSITAFEISPDGQQIALGLGQSDLYLLPYSQLFKLPQSSLPQNIIPLAECPYYAPYKTTSPLKAVDWSQVDNHLALHLSTQVDGATRDEVMVVDFDQCAASPQVIKDISPTYFLFTLPGYYARPEISSLSWNGDGQLLLNSYLNANGFGDLQLFNLDQNQSTGLAPNGTCCYRDAYWSPDGTYLFYTYQPEAGGEVSLYYVPLTDVEQFNAQLASLQLPAGFLTSSQDSLQPALRTAH